MRACLISLCAAFFAGSALAGAPELIRRDRQIPVRYVAPSRQTTPKTSQRETARKEAKSWLTKYAIDKPKGWKITNWEFKGQYGGPLTEGRSWSYYRMSFNPPIEVPGGPCFEIYFGFDGKELTVPAESHSRDRAPPRAPAVIDLPTQSIGGVRQVP
jgi:hypothetical protein